LYLNNLQKNNIFWSR